MPTEESKFIDWQFAQWISLPNAASADSVYMLARRKFEVPGEARFAALHICADLLYRVWINGVEVGNGPPRGTTSTVYFRSYDITSRLDPEANVIAIEVYCERNSSIAPLLNRRNASQTLMALLAQVDFIDDNGKRIAGEGTDLNWRVLPGSAWNPAAVMSANYAQCEIYDSRKEPDGWKHRSFDDIKWQEPEINRAGIDYRHLSPDFRPHRNVIAAPMAEPIASFRRPKSIVAIGEVIELDGRDDITDIGLKMGLESPLPLENCKIENVTSLIHSPQSGDPLAHVAAPCAYDDLAALHRALDTATGPVQVRHPFVVLDFGELLNGHFVLDIEGSVGAIVDIGWGQQLVGGRLQPRVYLPAELHDLSFADRLILRGGRQQWASFHYQSFRYVQLTFRNMDAKGVRLHSFHAKALESPLGRQGVFHCSDETLTWAWEAAERTLRLCAHDTFMDNTIRERGMYSGECAATAILASLACSAEDPLTRHFIGFFTGNLEENRFLLSVGDTWLHEPLKKEPLYTYHPLRLAHALCVYCFHADEKNTDRLGIWPAITHYLAHLADHRNAHGLLEGMSGHHFLDWAPLDNTEGEGAPQNLLYCLLLREASALARHYGERRLARNCKHAADAIVKTVFDRFWHAETGLYVDSVVQGRQRTLRFSEHTNYLALSCGLGLHGRTAILLDALESQSESLVQADLTFTFFAIDALFELGLDDKAISLMTKRLNRVQNQGYTTLPEEWSCFITRRDGTWNARYRSIAQNASCWPGYLLSKRVLGVRPIAPGFTEIEIAPHCGNLKFAAGTIPTPRGPLEISWERMNERRIEMTVRLPSGCRARVKVPTFESDSPTLLANEGLHCLTLKRAHHSPRTEKTTDAVV